MTDVIRIHTHIDTTRILTDQEVFCHSGADCVDCCYCCCLPSLTPPLHQRYDYYLTHLLKISAPLDKHMDTDTCRQHGLQTEVS